MALLTRKPRATPAAALKLGGENEARLAALACWQPPKGPARWSLRLLAERLVELEVVEAVSRETVRRPLEKSEQKPWFRRMWCIPPRQDAAFVRQMEQVRRSTGGPTTPPKAGIALAPKARDRGKRNRKLPWEISCHCRDARCTMDVRNLPMLGDFIERRCKFPGESARVNSYH